MAGHAGGTGRHELALAALDMAIVRLNRDAAGHASLVGLTGTYHNLLRMWAAP